MAISQLIELRSRGMASLKRIGTLLDATPTVKDREDVEIPDSFSGEIEFKNLSFKHTGGEYNALENVSFKINNGEHVGIIGKTGAGKTTITDLILRTYNVPDGTLYIGGHDVNKTPISWVRDHVAYVPQDNFLFSDTIENNISFSGQKNKEDIVSASKLSDIHDNITAFSKGYDTVLGERGVTISGGQKQRISIARALLKDADILILDDSVSAVDVKTEKTILENLQKTRKGKTTVLIAHRVSTIESMDKIIYIHNGQIQAVGTHTELYETCPSYKRTVELQRLDAKEGENNE
jgi:ATP-binding cassette subfamily B protein